MTVTELYKAIKNKDGYLPISSFMDNTGNMIIGDERGVPIKAVLPILSGYIDDGNGDLLNIDIELPICNTWKESKLTQYINKVYCENTNQYWVPKQSA